MVQTHTQPVQCLRQSVTPCQHSLRVVAGAQALEEVEQQQMEPLDREVLGSYPAQFPALTFVSANWHPTRHV